MSKISALLAELGGQMEKQLDWLEHSQAKCAAFEPEGLHSRDEFDAFEALSSRFGRSVDFLIRKAFRGIDEAEFTADGTMLDAIRRAEKRGLVDSLEQVRMLKNLRNEIEHEYRQEEIERLFSEILKETPVLIALFQRTLNYIQKLQTDLRGSPDDKRDE